MQEGGQAFLIACGRFLFFQQCLSPVRQSQLPCAILPKSRVRISYIFTQEVCGIFGEQAMFFESIGIKEAYASYWRLGDWFLFWVVQILFKQLTIFWHGFHGLRCFWFGKKVNVMVVLEFHSYGKRAGSCLLSKTACNTISDSSIV